MNPLDSITLTVPGLRREDGPKEDVRVWRTPDGDGVGLFYFRRPPDIPGDLDALDELRTALSRNTAAAGAAMIEASVTTIDGCRALRQCVKVPQEPSGMTYLGSLTLPFRDCSFVIKIQCEEHGVTGLREVVILQEKLDSGEVRPDSDGGMRGWMKDPHDPGRTAGLARTLADGAEYDERFPDHPLSRARRFLDALEGHITVGEPIHAAPPFVYVLAAPKRKPWWKLW